MSNVASVAFAASSVSPVSFGIVLPTAAVPEVVTNVVVTFGLLSRWVRKYAIATPATASAIAASARSIPRPNRRSGSGGGGGGGGRRVAARRGSFRRSASYRLVSRSRCVSNATVDGHRWVRVPGPRARRAGSGARLGRARDLVRAAAAGGGRLGARGRARRSPRSRRRSTESTRSSIPPTGRASGSGTSTSSARRPSPGRRRLPARPRLERSRLLRRARRLPRGGRARAGQLLRALESGGGAPRRAAHPAATIVRTSLIYGGDEEGPQERLARENRRFFVDELRSPVQVGDLAEAILELLALDPGPLHLGGADDISRFDFAVLLGADPA